MHRRRFRECSARTHLIWTLGKKYEEVTIRLAGGKAVPLSFVWCHACSHLSGRQAAEDHAVTVTRHRCGLHALNTSFWDAERHLHCQGNQCSEPACSKGCVGRATHDGQAVLCDAGDRGQLLAIPAQLPTLHRISDHHLVQRKTMCMSKGVSHLLLSPGDGKAASQVFTPAMLGSG